MLDQSGTDAEGFASGSNESSSSSAGGDSPRQLANERLVERRHIIEDLTDSEADSNSLQGGENGAKSQKSKLKKRSSASNGLVPDDYYMEQEPAFILNMRPKTYGKRLASSSAQTDQKLQVNGFMSTSTKSQKRHGVNLLAAAKRRRNKTQMQIPSHEPSPVPNQQSSQHQSSRLRPKSVEFGVSSSQVDSSLESHANADELHLDHLMESSLGDSMLHQTNDDEDQDQKWRTCTIQTDSDSVTVQYVTISSLADPGSAAAAATTTTATGHDDGYVSGSGELKRNANDQTVSKTAGHKSGLFLPFCASSGSADDDEADEKTATDSWLDETDQKDAGKRDRKRKKTAAKEKKSKKSSGSGKSSPTKLDVVLEAKAEQQPSEIEQPAAATETKADIKADMSMEAPLTDASIVSTGLEHQSGAGQLSGGEEADESLVTNTTSRSISPTTTSAKERKQQLKLEKQEKLKKEKLERQKQKELEEANAKAAKAQKKLEKEEKKKAEKAEKLAKKSAKRESPIESRAQSPELASVASNKQDGVDTEPKSQNEGQKQAGGGVLGAITKTIQSVKFAPSPSKDSTSGSADDKSSASQTLQEPQVVADEQSAKTMADSAAATTDKPDEGESSMVHVSIGTESALLSGDEVDRSERSELDDDSTRAQQLISFSSETETIPASATNATVARQSLTSEQKVPLKPILKQQSSSLEEAPQPSVVSAELKIDEPKALASIADELISEATEEAVRAADALQRGGQLSSGASSPTLTGSVSESKKEAAKRLKAEKDKLKAEIKLSLSEEKRLMKEAELAAEQAEEAAKRAEHEAKNAASKAMYEAERQAIIAKKEAEEALKLIQDQEATTTTKAITDQVEASQQVEQVLDKSELKKRAKQAEAEAKRLAKAAEDEAKRVAKEAKLEAERLAKEAKAKLKAEKKNKKQSSKSVEPSAPSLDLVSSSSPDQSEATATASASSPPKSQETQPETIGLPQVSFELNQSETQLKEPQIDEPESSKQVAQEELTSVKPDADVSEQATTEPVAVAEKSVASSSSESKKSKKSKKDQKKRKISKRDADTGSLSSASSKNESSATEMVSKSSFLGRLFRLKPKQPKQSSDDLPPPYSATEQQPDAVKQQEDEQQQQRPQNDQQQQQMIVSEMYPSDPNNADGEMILEVNVPEELINETRRSGHQAAQAQEQGQLPEEKVTASAVTSIVTSTTGHQGAEPTDDQEATLVNLSQMVDDVNDEDDDEATENVLSQANDFVESSVGHLSDQQQHLQQQAHEDSVVALVQDQCLQEQAQPVEPDEVARQQVTALEVAAQDTQKTLGASEVGADDESNVAPKEVVNQELESPVAAQVASQAANDPSTAKGVAKNEKARKELEAKLEKEAKKRAKEEEKLRKKQEKEDKKRAELEAKKQAKEEKERLKREAKEAKRLAELAKKEAKKNKQKGGKAGASEAPAGTSSGVSKLNADSPQEPVEGDATNQDQEQQQQPTTITTTTITSSTTTTGDDSRLNPSMGEEADAARVLLSSTSEVPINEETEVEQIVEEVVGEDGTVTKTTKTIETKYVTMRQEEVRVAERRDIPLEEWQRMESERAEQQLARPSTSDGQFIERHQGPAHPSEFVVPPELEEIRTMPSYFDPSQPLAEIKPTTSEKKALRKRIKLNQKLIKRAYKLAKSQSKKAKRDQLKAEAEIAVCDEAARQARKELKRAVKEAKRAAKVTEQQHKKMDKIDKKLAKRAKELEKRQKKIDKKLAKAAKKQAKKDEKAAVKAAKLQRKGSSSSSTRSPSRGSKRSIKAEDIGEPVLRSSSRLSIVQNNPNVELSPRQQQFVDAGVAASVAAASSGDPQVDVSLEDNVQLQDGQQGLSQQQIEQMVRDGELEVVHTITRETLVEQPGDEAGAPLVEQIHVLTGEAAEAAAMRMELEAARDEDEEMMIDVVGDGDEPKPTETGGSASPETNSAEQDKENLATAEATADANGNQSPETTPNKKKNKKKNKRQKSKEAATAD